MGGVNIQPILIPDDYCNSYPALQADWSAREVWEGCWVTRYCLTIASLVPMHPATSRRHFTLLQERHWQPKRSRQNTEEPYIELDPFSNRTRLHCGTFLTECNSTAITPHYLTTGSATIPMPPNVNTGYTAWDSEIESLTSLIKLHQNDRRSAPCGQIGAATQPPVLATSPTLKKF